MDNDLDEAMNERVEAYTAVKERLMVEGMTDLWVGGAVRLEIHGYLPDGRYFYFGARGERCGLKVWTGPVEMDEDGWPTRHSDWEKTIFPKPFPEMTWLDPHEGERYFRQLLSEVPKETKSN